MKKMVTIDTISCESTDMEELVNSWRTLYPEMTEDEIKRMRQTAERLTPKWMKFVLEEDNSKDYSKKLLLAVKKDQQVLLIWPKGTGKTTSIYYLSQETENPLVPIQLNGWTGVDSLVWKWLVNKEWTYRQDGSFTMARRYGFWIVLDEINMMLPEIAAVLHPALDDRRVLVLDEKNWEVIERHPNCKIFGAMNPTEDYAGTKEMNQAFVDRFAWQIIVDYPEARKERAIVLAHKKVDIDDTAGTRVREWIITRMVKVANWLRKLNKEQKLLFECSTRNLIDWACRCSELTVKEACELALLSKADKEDRATIQDEVNKFFKDDEKRISKEEKKLLKKASISEGAVWDIEVWEVVDWQLYVDNNMSF